MKNTFIIITLFFIISCTAAQTKTESDKPANQPLKEDYIDVICERLAFHLSPHLWSVDSKTIKDTIYYEMPYPRVYAILVFSTKGEYIDGFIKEDGKIIPLIYTVYFRDPSGMSFRVKKIYYNTNEIGILKLFYR